MVQTTTRRLLLAACSLVLCAPRLATPQPAPDIRIDASERAAVIAGALEALRDAYVFPDVAETMASAIRAHQQRGDYDAITSGREFARTLTDDLREVSHDLHLGIVLIPDAPPPPAAPTVGPSLEERQRAIAARENFGFARVERLTGNVGYLDLRGFMPPGLAGDTAAAAMTFLASSDAVIIDLRQNGGGSPLMVAYLASYLFGAAPVHLNDFYSRVSGETRQSWTLAYVPGRRMPDTDVYVLTSARTFSGAEEFTYDLKQLKRVTIVGETTGGGAHTVTGRRVSAHFGINLPEGRPINPVTGTDWEGTGVEPDVRVAAEDALAVAHLMALEKLRSRLTDRDGPEFRNEVNKAADALRGELGDRAPAPPARPRPQPASAIHEDFETGSLAAWTIDLHGGGGWFTYSDGRTPPDRSRSDPNVPFSVPQPPQGRFAAVTDENAPGRLILYRDIELDGKYRVHMTVFYVNAGRFSAVVPAEGRMGEEQQFRIDIMSPDAPVDSIAPGDVLATIFQARPDDPARGEPADVTLDLSPWAGRTVRLRLAVGDNQAPLRAGVDDIRFERVEP